MKQTKMWLNKIKQQTWCQLAEFWL